MQLVSFQTEVAGVGILYSCSDEIRFLLLLQKILTVNNPTLTLTRKINNVHSLLPDERSSPSESRSWNFLRHPLWIGP